MDVIKAIEAEQIKDGAESFRIGDTVKVHYRIVEGKNERVQVYEGLVISANNSGVGRTVTVRKISYGVGVERIFPVNSPRVEKFEVTRRGKVRRAKLYYMRNRIGKKATKVKELIKSRKQQAAG
ncbi:MAG: 50S ribosomal protein L19 [Spirochaetaceae bacterium]|nr:50S ribosomal protein L19 [Spirochaetaceae bacterium]MDT8296756.1 50S ribosomal protein L19 [Spirochaetaceae bacterium]